MSLVRVEVAPVPVAAAAACEAALAPWCPVIVQTLDEAGGRVALTG